MNISVATPLLIIPPTYCVDTDRPNCYVEESAKKTQSSHSAAIKRPRTLLYKSVGPSRQENILLRPCISLWQWPTLPSHRSILILSAWWMWSGGSRGITMELVVSHSEGRSALAVVSAGSTIPNRHNISFPVLGVFTLECSEHSFHSSTLPVWPLQTLHLPYAAILVLFLLLLQILLWFQLARPGCLYAFVNHRVMYLKCMIWTHCQTWSIGLKHLLSA